MFCIRLSKCLVVWPSNLQYEQDRYMIVIVNFWLRINYLYNPLSIETKYTQEFLGQFLDNARIF